MKKKILIADDELSTCELIEFILQKNGMEPLIVYSGRKAIETALAEKPDAILLDIMMPGMDGIEVCSILKNNQDTKNIPILFLTALGQEADVERGLKMGANGYMTKPFDPSDLLEHVKRLLAYP